MLARFKVLILAFSFIIGLKCLAQQAPCPININWETGDTSGWVAFAGGPSTANNGQQVLPGGVSQVSTNPNFTTFTTPVSGFRNGRHTIMNTGMPNDPFGNFPVVSPYGGQFSIMLGDQTINYPASRVQYSFTVPAGNDKYAINFLYAVVLFDANHDPNEQPRFTVSVLDAATGQSLKDGCYDLNFVADANMPGFYTSPSNNYVRYKPWTEHTLNLSGAAGKTVIVDVAVAGCSLGGHWGYGYFDVIDCGEFKVVLDSCNLDGGGAYMHGPDGYMSYQWFNQDYSQLIDTGKYAAFQPLTVTPQIYHAVLTPYPSVSQCPDTIHTTPLANIAIARIDSTCLLPNTSVTLNPAVSGGAGAFSFEWNEIKPYNSLSCTACHAPVAKTPLSNSYILMVHDTAGCYKSEIMDIGINENKIKAIDDFVLCRPGYTQLDAVASGPAPLTAVKCGLANVAFCNSPDTVNLRNLYRAPFIGRADTSTVINPFAAQYSSARMQFLINKKDIYASGLRYGAINSLGFEVADPGTATFGNFSISLLCTDLNSVGGSFIAGATPVYTSVSPVTPHSGWNDFSFTQPYNWDTSKNLLVDVCFSNLSTNKPAIVIVLNTGNQDALAGFSIVPNSNVCLTGATTSIKYYKARPSMRANFCKSPDAPFRYTWMPSTFLEDSTIKSPMVYLPKTSKYWVQTSGGDDCKVEDSVTVTVPVHDYDIFPKDTSVCYGTPFEIVAAGTPAAVQWYECDPASNSYTIPTSLICNACSDPAKVLRPIAKGLKSLKYAAVYTDVYGCKDTLTMNSFVRPLPKVHILNEDTTIKYGQGLQLHVSGAYLYSWSPLSALTHPNVANPYVSPTEPTTFYVWGLADDGCRNVDSVRVNIDYRHNLFVPSAFTPNGDGKNDVFRISNITFQKLQKFRVFNRWGQEIYSTTNPQEGWDGSWRGVPQDMGVYHYIIKVAYPDGYVETYKGDVSLVR